MSDSRFEIIEFHGAQLVAIPGADRATTMVFAKPMTDGAGLQWAAQLRRMKRDDVLRTCMSKMDTQIPGDTQVREHWLIPQNRVAHWMSGISLNHVKDPGARERLLQFKHEAADAIDSHFEAKAPARAGGPMTRAEIREMMRQVQADTIAGAVPVIVEQVTKAMSPILGAMNKHNRKTIIEETKAAMQDATNLVIGQAVSAFAAIKTEFDGIKSDFAAGFEATRTANEGFVAMNDFLIDRCKVTETKKRNRLTSKCSKAILFWMASVGGKQNMMRKQVLGTRRERKVFHIDLLTEWYDLEGSKLIRDYMDKQRGQNTMWTVFDGGKKDSKPG